jgi:uncharacterized protein YjbI with pentapeptide repeats
MMFNRNQNGQASKEPNKATSVDEDVTTVDWMIMTDIGTRIGKIPKSKPESQLQSKPEPKSKLEPQSKPEPQSEFKQVTKQEPNKLSAIATPTQVSSNQAADDDREDIEWLKSLDLDKPIERILSTRKTTGNNQQNATNNADGNGNNGNNDVEKIDWLIVSDLNKKKIDSGFNHNSNSSESLPIASPNIPPDHTVLQVYPPSVEIQTNIVSASNPENDFGDLGLDDLELSADDDLGDLQFDDFDEMKLNELISGIGVTDNKLQELSELMDDKFSLNDYSDGSNDHDLEHELDTILGIASTVYPNDELGMVSEQSYSHVEEDLRLEENLIDDSNNLEDDFTNLQEGLVSEFGDLAEYPVAEYPSDDLAEYPSDDLAEYPIADYPVDDLVDYPVAEYPSNDLVEYPVAGYPSDDLVDYSVAGYPSDDLVDYPVAGYPSDDLVDYPVAGYPSDDLAEYPVADYPVDLENDLQEDLEIDLERDYESPSAYLIENLAVTEEIEVAQQDAFVNDDFNSPNYDNYDEFAIQEVNVPDLVNPLDDGFGEVSPIVLDASLLGDEIWASSAIASSEDLDGESLESNFDNAFAGDWGEDSQDISSDINSDINNDAIWDSSANIIPEVITSTTIENAFGSVDDWAIAPQVDPLQVDPLQSEPFDLSINVGFDFPSDLPIDLPSGLPIDLPPEEQFLQGLEEDIEVPSKSIAKSPFTEQEYLELQEYDRIFATAEVTPEIISENSAELAIASVSNVDANIGANVGMGVANDQENTYLQSEIDSAEIDDLGWNPEAESQLLADMETEDYEEWNDDLQSENLLDGNDHDLDWNGQPESALVDELEITDDDYAEWQTELQSEDDNDTSWQDGLDGLIDSEQYSEDYSGDYLDGFEVIADQIPDQIPQIVTSGGTVDELIHNEVNHNNDDLLESDLLESDLLEPDNLVPDNLIPDTIDSYINGNSNLSSDWDEFEQPKTEQIVDFDFADDFSDYEATSLLSGSLNSPSSNDWKPDENQSTVVDDFDDMDSIIDENFDLASFDEGQFPETPLTNSDSVNIATTLTPNRIPSVSIPKPEFTDLPSPAIASKDNFSEDMLLEDSFANDLLDQNYDLDVDPFEEALAIDLLNGYTSSTSGFEQIDDFAPASEILPPPNSTPPSNFVMSPSNNDFLDDFDFDSIEIQDFGDKDNSRLPAISTGLNPSAPPLEPIAKPEPTINNSFLPPPSLPPLPPKRNHTQGRTATGISQIPSIQPQNIQPNIQPTRDYVDNIDEDSNFDGFHIQENQNKFQNSVRKPVNLVDESWSDLLNADTVISGVLHSPPANMNPNVTMSQQSKGSTAGKNSQGRDSRDQASAKNSFQRQPNNLPDFADLGLEIHDDNTDWSGLLDSDEANDSITSISTQMPPLPRAQVDISAFNTNITGSSPTRELPRDQRQPVANYGDANQVRMGTPPDQMNFNRFTENNYDSYGSSQGTAAQNRNKPHSKTSTLSLESLWQNYLKIPVIGLGAIGAAFLLYTLTNKPIFELGLRWGMFKDASGRDFRDADFRGAKLDNVNFSNAILTSAKMQDASLSGANFYEANLNGVNFTNANLRGARLIRASVVWSEFKNTQMSLADLAEADLTRSNFATAKMEGANLKDSKIGAQGTEAATIFSPTTLLAWQIVNEPKSNRNLANQNLAGLNLSFASLKKANLSNANLNFVDMTKTDLSGANLIGTQVNGANWTGANLAAINLSNVVFDKSKLPKTDETTTCPNGKKGPCKFL